MERSRQGAFILCPGCGIELEVISIDPLKAELVLEYEAWRDEGNR